MNTPEQMLELVDIQLRALEQKVEKLQREMAEYQRIRESLGRLGGEPIAASNTSRMISSGGFAQRIVAVVHAANRAVNAREVAEVLTANGYQYPGKVDLRIAVASELARLAKRAASGIHREAAGMYSAA